MSRILITSIIVSLMTAVLYAEEKASLTPAEKQAIAQIQKSGGQAMAVAQNDLRLEVAFHLSGKPVTANTLKPLQQLPRLIHLNLRSTTFSDKEAPLLKNLKSLVKLHLEKTKVTNKGLANLKGLTNLEYLNLYGTQITDAGLVHLSGMKKLKRLYLWKTKTTPAGIAKLKKSLPKLTVISEVKLKIIPPKKKTPKKKTPKKKKPAKKKKLAKKK
ncbi:hypothetical protein MNBD_PLANCTO02-2625 [hydrothermal vent metagenome]|uniref:Leucine Rich repeats (2 copies) n=1 Tax=hydrothermal vent metagenome TaxID=652676 RepID=A0A3B1DRG2_9ZZZZ